MNQILEIMLCMSFHTQEIYLTNTLKERMKHHVRESSIKQHMQLFHDKNIEILKMFEQQGNFIMGKKNYKKKLIFLKSILRKRNRLIIKFQTENFLQF